MEFEDLNIDSLKVHRMCPLESHPLLPGVLDTQFKYGWTRAYCLTEIPNSESLLPLAQWEVSSLFPADDTVLIYFKK